MFLRFHRYEILMSQVETVLRIGWPLGQVVSPISSLKKEVLWTEEELYFLSVEVAVTSGHFSGGVIDCMLQGNTEAGTTCIDSVHGSPKSLFL